MQVLNILNIHMVLVDFKGSTPNQYEYSFLII